MSDALTQLTLQQLGNQSKRQSGTSESSKALSLGDPRLPGASKNAGGKEPGSGAQLPGLASKAALPALADKSEREPLSPENSCSFSGYLTYCP